MDGGPYTLLYLLGSGRNGSTVLDLILAGHPSVLALGEISTLNRVYDPFAPPGDDRVARQWADRYRDFWTRVRRAYEERTGRPFDALDIRHPRLRRALRMGREEAEPWVTANLEVLDAAHAVSGRPVLSDASKVPQRLLLLRRSGRVRVKVLHLLRDGRAVSCSYLRRYGSFAGGVRTWAQTELCSLYLRRLFADEDWLDIRYEEFAARPERALRGVCGFLGLPYQESILEFRRNRYLGIGGNPTVKAAEDGVVRPDHRWRGELSLRRRLAFGLRVGWLNRLTGYPAFAWERRARDRHPG